MGLLHKLAKHYLGRPQYSGFILFRFLPNGTARSSSRTRSPPGPSPGRSDPQSPTENLKRQTKYFVAWEWKKFLLPADTPPPPIRTRPAPPSPGRKRRRRGRSGSRRGGGTRWPRRSPYFECRRGNLNREENVLSPHTLAWAQCP